MDAPAAPTLDVLTVGSAIVDVLAHCDDGLIAALHKRKEEITS